jgi:hypothetical protein
MPLRHVELVAPVLAVGLLTACGSSDGSSDPSSSTVGGSPTTGSTAPLTSAPAPSPSGARLPTASTLPPDLRERPEVAMAVADAARRQKVPEERIAIAAWTPVTWDDGSIGCPSEGEAYTQATVDGELLLLRVDRVLLAYHAGPDGTFAYCADPRGTYAVRAS